MPDQKISQLSTGTNAQAGDLFVIARGATNLSLTTAQLFNAPSAAATFASLTVSGKANVQSAGVPTSGFYDGLSVSSFDAIGWTGSNVLVIGGYRSSQWSGISLYTAGTAQAILNGSGNLGLGVTPSAWATLVPALQLGTGGAFLAARTTLPEVYLGANAHFDGSNWKYKTAAVASFYAQDTGNHRWFSAAAGANPGDTITFGDAKMVLDASGNLGVGAPSPSVNGIDVVKAGGTATYVRTSDGTYAMLSGVAPSLGGALVGTTSNHPVILYANNTERARITAAGSVVAGGSVALATTATDGFLYVPTCAGTPTGTPTAITGMAPIVVDTTNNKLYFYSNAAWRDAGP